MGSSVRPMAPEQSVTKCNIFQGLKPPTRSMEYDRDLDEWILMDILNIPHFNAG